MKLIFGTFAYNQHDPMWRLSNVKSLGAEINFCSFRFILQSNIIYLYISILLSAQNELDILTSNTNEIFFVLYRYRLGY